MSLMRLSLSICWLAALAASLSACAALDPRNDPYQRYLFFGEDMTLQLHCDAGTTPISGQGTEVPLTTLGIRETPTYPAPKVADLGSYPDYIPVYLAGEKANSILFEDVRRVLADSGYQVVDEPSEYEVVFEATFTMLWFIVRPNYATESFAVASFVTVLSDSAGTLLWEGVFNGRDQYQHRTQSSHLIDGEAALGRAYCRSLESFAEAVREPGFIQALQRE